MIGSFCFLDTWEEMLGKTNGSSFPPLKKGVHVYTFIGTALVKCRIHSIEDLFTCTYKVAPCNYIAALQIEATQGRRKGTKRYLQVRLHPIYQVTALDQMTSNRNWGLARDLGREIAKQYPATS